MVITIKSICSALFLAFDEQLKQNGVLSENRKSFSWKMQTCQVKSRLEEQKENENLFTYLLKMTPEDNVLITTLPTS